MDSVDDLLACQSAVIAGRYELIPYKSYVEYLDALKTAHFQLRSRTLFSTRATIQYKQVTNVIRKIELIQFAGSIRKQPFGVLIVGPPGCGKSKATFEIAKSCMKTIGHNLQAEEMVVLNESDKYQSEYRSSHKVVVFDDVGSTRLQLLQEDPYRKVIDFINNIPRSALNPHLELKGNVQIRPDIVMMTANALDLASQTQVEVGAFYRRFPIKIFLKDRNNACLCVDPEHADWGNFERFEDIKKYMADQCQNTEFIPIKDLIEKYVIPAFREHEKEQKFYMNSVALPSSDRESMTFFQRLVSLFRRDRSDAIVAQALTDESFDPNTRTRFATGRCALKNEVDESELTDDIWIEPQQYLPIQYSNRYALSAQFILKSYRSCLGPLYGPTSIGLFNEDKVAEATDLVTKFAFSLTPSFEVERHCFWYKQTCYAWKPDFSSINQNRAHNMKSLYDDWLFLSIILRWDAAFQFCRKLDINNHCQNEHQYLDLLSKMPMETLMIAKDFTISDSKQCDLLLLHPMTKSLLIVQRKETYSSVVTDVQSKLMAKLRKTNFPHGKYTLYTVSYDENLDICDIVKTNGIGRSEAVLKQLLQPNVAGPAICS